MKMEIESFVNSLPKVVKLNILFKRTVVDGFLEFFKNIFI